MQAVFLRWCGWMQPVCADGEHPSLNGFRCARTPASPRGFSFFAERWGLENRCFTQFHTYGATCRTAHRLRCQCTRIGIKACRRGISNTAGTLLVELEGWKREAGAKL